jgi:hypothetical protein
MQTGQAIDWLIQVVDGLFYSIDRLHQTIDWLIQNKDSLF